MSHNNVKESMNNILNDLKSLENLNDINSLKRKKNLIIKLRNNLNLIKRYENIFKNKFGKVDYSKQILEIENILNIKSGFIFKKIEPLEVFIDKEIILKSKNENAKTIVYLNKIPKLIAGLAILVSLLANSVFANDLNLNNLVFQDDNGITHMYKKIPNTKYFVEGTSKHGVGAAQMVVDYNLDFIKSHVTELNLETINENKDNIIGSDELKKIEKKYIKPNTIEVQQKVNGKIVFEKNIKIGSVEEKYYNYLNNLNENDYIELIKDQKNLLMFNISHFKELKKSGGLKKDDLNNILTNIKEVYQEFKLIHGKTLDKTNTFENVLKILIGNNNITNLFK